MSTTIHSPSRVGSHAARTRRSATRTCVGALAGLVGLLLLTSCDTNSVVTPRGPNDQASATRVAQKGNGKLAFANFELGSQPGTACPGSTDCTNAAAEPAIRADNEGNFYAASELGLSAGTLAWKSTDGGLHYTSLESPNQISQSVEDLAPGGGDVDVATAPEPNGSGIRNVYVSSLSLANVTVSRSTDGGKSWSKNILSATIPGDDREWIAADGASKVCISYHDVVTFNIDVNCSFDAGASFTQIGSAIDLEHAFLLQENSTGNLVIDPNSHTIYQVFSGIANATEAVLTAGLHAVWIGVSHDGGQTFRDYAVYINDDVNVSYGHQFINATVDRAGTVYAVYSDNHNLFYSFSKNFGETWTGPFRVSQAPSATAVMPWSAACDPGQLEIVWYGSSFSDPSTVPDDFPESAQWQVFFAQNRQASTAGSSFTQVAATPVIHLGGVCEGGVSCTGNRDLFDDFGIAVSPTTGLASIVYSDDQPGNTSSDNHTAVATQIGGPAICSGT